MKSTMKGFSTWFDVIINNDQKYALAINKKADHKPDSVTHLYEILIIYLVLKLLLESNRLPSNIGRATLKSWYTWRCTA